jgi:hypothetical protein
LRVISIKLVTWVHDALCFNLLLKKREKKIIILTQES